MRPTARAALRVLAALLLLTAQAQAIRWLALRQPDVQWNSTSSCRRARAELGLARRQAKLCRETIDAMPHVAQAAVMAGAACQSALADRRWNCSSVERAPDFTADLTTGTREQAYVYALSSAAVVFTVARACALGALFHCACAGVPRDPPNGDFKWGGCGDNTRWGTKFARQFTDSAERRAISAEHASGAAMLTVPSVTGVVRQQREGHARTHRLGYRRLAVTSSLRPFHDAGAELGERPEANTQSVFAQHVPARARAFERMRDDRRLPELRSAGDAVALSAHERQRRRVKATIAAVNLHNNRAGRRAVESSLVTQCKCHGVSGSCNIKTCWRSLPRFADVAERLKRRFGVASEVVSRRVGAGRKLLPATPSAGGGAFGQDDMIYSAKSPDYCMRNAKVGSLGTRGRSCNATASGYGSCDEMCCGRGFRTRHVERVERCQCKYYWCCYVQCNTCRRWVETHECN